MIKNEVRIPGQDKAKRSSVYWNDKEYKIKTGWMTGLDADEVFEEVEDIQTKLGSVKTKKESRELTKELLTKMKEYFDVLIGEEDADEIFNTINENYDFNTAVEELMLLFYTFYIVMNGKSQKEVDEFFRHMEKQKSTTDNQTESE